MIVMQVSRKTEVQISYKTEVREVKQREVRIENNNKVREFGTFSSKKFVYYDEMD